MAFYFAVSSKLVFMGSLQDCLENAQNMIADKKAKIVKIFRARAGDKKAFIIGEVTKDGFRDTPHSRCIDLKILTNEAKNGKAQS